jgi:hypothetical protein
MDFQLQFVLTEFLKRTNCLKRGNMENTKGIKYLVAVDGTEASWRAFDAALKKVTAEDHLIVALIWRNHKHRGTEEEVLILNHIAWNEAYRLLQQFETALLNSRKVGSGWLVGWLILTFLQQIEYTMVIPGAWDPRRMIVLMCSKWNIGGVFIGRHRKEERKHHGAGRTSRTAMHNHLRNSLAKDRELFIL